jgi:hypothetical protein
MSEFDTVSSPGTLQVDDLNREVARLQVLGGQPKHDSCQMTISPHKSISDSDLQLMQLGEGRLAVS